ncbi:MAG: GUN4 domain-containing protein [Planktothrix sp.]|uniref:GUN4 domain-containing protein n=2 Tax=Planktothrix sp. TaxID=3088171 RepID=UPI0038D3721D
MPRSYEMMCILHPQLAKQEVYETLEKFYNHLIIYGASDIKFIDPVVSYEIKGLDYNIPDDSKNKILVQQLVSYPVLKRRKGIFIRRDKKANLKKVPGIYIKITYKANGQQATKLYKEIQGYEQVVRCLVVRVKKQVDYAAKNSNIFIQEQNGNDNNNDNEQLEPEYIENDEAQENEISPEEQEILKKKNYLDLTNKVNTIPELDNYRKEANEDAWKDLTEWIAESIGEINFGAAEKSVNRLKSRSRNQTPYEIAHQLIIHKSLQAAGVELIADVVQTVNCILNGLQTIELPRLSKLAAEMIYQIADIYGFDAKATERKTEALYIFGFTLLSEKVVEAGIDWLKSGIALTKALKVGAKALMIYGIGHLACYYYKYKSQYKFELVPSEDLVLQLNQISQDYFPENTSEEIVKDKLTNEIYQAFPPISYDSLNSLLAQGQWKNADQETGSIILELLNRNIKDKVALIPGEEIRNIDKLWTFHSQGKFGFKIQRSFYFTDKKIESLTAKLDWRTWFGCKNYEKLILDLDKAPEGHLPAFWLNIYADLKLPEQKNIRESASYLFKPDEVNRYLTIKWYLKPILERNDWES